MDYFEQETDYTCAVACMRMIMQHFGREVLSESEICKLTNTGEKHGTHPYDIVRVFEELDYESNLIEDSGMSDLRLFTLKGYVCMLLAQCDVPHCIIYLTDNGNHMKYHDPFFGPNKTISINKFISPNQRYPHMRWMLEVESLKKYYSEYDIDTSRFLVGTRQFIAVKPRNLSII